MIRETAERLLTYFEDGGEYEGDPLEDMKEVYDALSGVGLVPARPPEDASFDAGTSDTAWEHQLSSRQ